MESQLAAYLEEFLAIENFRKNAFLKEYSLIQEYSRRGSEALFLKKFTKLKRAVENSTEASSLNYLHLYQLQVELQKFVVKHQQRGKESFAQSLSEAFDVWWIHEKMKLANNDLNHYLIKGKQISTLFLDQLLQVIQEQEPFSSMPLLKIYEQLYKLQKGEGRGEEMIDLVQAHQHQLAKAEVMDMFALVFNYYVRKVFENGRKEDSEILLRLQLWGIKERFVFQDGYLPRKMYNNLIATYLRLGQVDMALEALSKFKDGMSPTVQEEAYAFNLGCCLFARREYGKMRKILSIRFSNVYYEIRARLLLCRSRFEMDDTDRLETELRSLRVFISRQKDLTEHRKQSEIHQIQLFEKLLNAQTREDFVTLRKLVDSTHPLGDKEWIQEKIRERM